MFVGVLNYSMYAYAEAFPDEKQKSWNDAHIHMFEFFGGVSKMLVPDNCKTAVTRNRKYADELNSSWVADNYGEAYSRIACRSADYIYELVREEFLAKR